MKNLEILNETVLNNNAVVEVKKETTKKETTKKVSPKKVSPKKSTEKKVLTNEEKNIIQNNISYKDILNRLNKNNIVSTLGTEKITLYKKELFLNVPENKHKSIRAKFRNYTLNLLISATLTSDKKTLLSIKNDLYNLCDNVFNTNFKNKEILFENLFNENLGQSKKDIVYKGLKILNAIK